MRKLLLSVNVDDFLDHYHRDSFVDAARRWGCDYLEITTEIKGYVSCALREIFLESQRGWDRVCWIDADCLIRSDSPSVFDAAEDTSALYGVADATAADLTIEERESIVQVVHRSWYEKLEKRIKAGVCEKRYLDRFVNGGLIVINPEQHRDALTMFVFQIATAEPAERMSAHFEQALFNYCLHARGIPIEHLDRAWNRLQPPPGRKMHTDYVWHFTGLDAIHQKTRVGKTEWKI